MQVDTRFTQVRGPCEKVKPLLLPYSLCSVSRVESLQYRVLLLFLVLWKVEEWIDLSHTGGPALPYILGGQVTGLETLIRVKTSLPLDNGYHTVLCRWPT